MLLRAAVTGLLLSLATAALLASAPAMSQSGGAAILRQRCAGCHVDGSESSPTGPALQGVFGRRVASLPDFDYSPALKAKADRRWTASELDAFLTDPGRYAPGTAMTAQPLSPAERAAIIGALRVETQPAK